MNTTPTANKETLQQALRSFRILGAASQGEIIKLLDSRVTGNARETIKDEFYRKGGLAGRVLLHAWGEHNPDLGKEVTEWLRDDPVPQIDESTIENGVCALWRHTTPLQISPTHLALLEKVAKPLFQEQSIPVSHYTPFGPEKAEDDPRLPLQGSTAASEDGSRLPPQETTTASEENSCSQQNPASKGKITGLFYEKIPWYPEIVAERHSLFFAPHGCGRTAAIWNARHIHRITGYSPALSLYLLLNPPYDPAHLRDIVAGALAQALRCALVEDAYWLISADHETQADIGRFMLWWAGDLATLLRRLRNGGLPITTSPIRISSKESDIFYDGRLVADILGRYSSLDHIDWDDLANIAQTACTAIKKTYPTPKENWDYPVYFWVDSNLPESVASQDLPALWQNEFLRRIGNLKIFTSHKLPDPVQICMEWSLGNLNAMLEHRWARVKAESFLDQQHLEKDSYEQLGKFREEIDKVHGPQEMIRKGNRLLETMGKSLSAGR